MRRAPVLHGRMRLYGFGRCASAAHLAMGTRAARHVRHAVAATRIYAQGWRGVWQGTPACSCTCWRCGRQIAMSMGYVLGIGLLASCSGSLVAGGTRAFHLDPILRLLIDCLNYP
eukprot:1467140-Pleurochrysis_carterae.AAC.4